MPACPFEDPDLLYDAYKEQVMLDGFNEDSSTKLLAWCLQKDAEKHNFKDNISIPTYRELFTTAVWPLVNDLQFGRPVPRQLGEIGLDSRLSPDCLYERLSYLLTAVYGEVYGESFPTNLWKKLNLALVDLVMSRGYGQVLPICLTNTARLIGWEGLLLWHYCVSTQVSQFRINLRSGIFNTLKTQWPKSNASYLGLRIPYRFKIAIFPTIEMMEVLKDNPITWLAVFSKCVYAAEKNAELGNTSDPDVRRYALNYLKVARSSYLKGSAAELASERVSKGIEAFSAYAMKSGAKLGGSLRGRHPSNPVAARAAAVARFCMWGFPYQNFVWRAVRQAMLGFLVPDPKLNKSDWKLLLTALLLYPLSADAATVHRWLKHLNERFDGETLGGMSVVIWHRQLEESGIAVYKDIAWAVVSVAEEWHSFWRS